MKVDCYSLRRPFVLLSTDRRAVDQAWLVWTCVSNRFGTLNLRFHAVTALEGSILK